MKKNDLTTGNVMSVLMALALPIMGSSLLQFTYNLVDMLWIGHLGSGAVASIGSASFFINLGYAISSLIMVGTGIKVAHCMGKKDQRAMAEYIQIGIRSTAILAGVYAILLMVLGKGLIGFFKLDDIKVARQAYHYLVWSAPMIFFACFNQLFTRLFASMGNTKSALWISAIGVVINMLLDPIFIYLLGWGVNGAAVATLIANAFMLMLYVQMGRSVFSLQLSRKRDWDKFKEISRLGAPMAYQRILFTVINILLAKLIATFGAEAVAAQKIGVQIEAVTYMVTGGLNGAVASFVGQNYGAKVYERLHQGYRAALVVGCGYAMCCATIFWLLPKQLAYLFVKEEGTLMITASYLVIIGYSQVFNAMEMVTSGLLTGIGKPKISSMVSVVFTTLRLPIAYLCVQYMGLNGIWWSITISTIIKGSVLVGIYLMHIRKQLKEVVA